MRGHSGRGEWSLVFFTILTQMAAGAFSIWGLIFVLAPSDFLSVRFSQAVLWTTLISLALGGISAFLHLGNPFRVGFVLSNLRSSWLSREGFLSGLFGLFVLILLVAQIFGLNNGIFNTLSIMLAIVVGFLLVYSISRLYMLRTVPAWNNLGTPRHSLPAVSYSAQL